jgi:hypothetical protein
MDLETTDSVVPRMTGHVLIRDPETGATLLDKKNAIHYENMSLAIGYSLANNGKGIIYSMAFGNGGSAVSGTGAITYFPTNTTDPKADLYDPTYQKLINATTTNFIDVKHLLGTPYTDIVVTCTLDYNEPSGQAAFDDSSNTDGTYVFDELGLKTSEGLLLTHVIFNPIQKSLNRLIEVVYTLRIQMS